MLQDIGEHIFRNEYTLRRKPEDGDYVLAFRDKSVYIRGNGAGEELELPEAGLFDKSLLLYLFSIDGRAYYLFTGDAGTLSLDGFSWQSNTVLRSDNPRITCFAGFTAYHLYSWYAGNRFCGRCGHETVHSSKERALTCPHCGNVIYPKIAPAVIVGITDGNRILVTRYKDRPYRGLALIAGFCEIGETPEQTACREAMEEVGLKIKDLRYCGSQPWGLDSNILFGFMARVDGDTTIIRDENELAEAFWISRDELTEPDSTISLTKTMINSFKLHGFSFANLTEHPEKQP